jgi:hypothetical protein
MHALDYNSICSLISLQKLTVFVFKKIIVLTRPTHHHDRQCYQVYRYPLPLSDLLVEDLKDGEVKMGSFRNMLGQGQGSE